MPVEIKQLIIKSKTINNNSKREQPEAERPNGGLERNDREKSLPYHLIHLAYSVRER